MATEKFINSKIDFNELLEFGFSKKKQFYEYQIPIVDHQFDLMVDCKINPNFLTN